MIERMWPSESSSSGPSKPPAPPKHDPILESLKTLDTEEYVSQLLANSPQLELVVISNNNQSPDRYIRVGRSAEGDLHFEGLTVAEGREILQKETPFAPYGFTRSF